MGDLDWRVVRELMAVGERLREVVEQALLPRPRRLTRPVTFEPLVDVWETDTEVIVEAELPGSRGGDIDLRLEGSSLVLSGELPESAQPLGSYLRIERPRGHFHRAVSLPVEVAGEPRANLRGGVLQVRMPKAPAPSRRRVSIAREGA
jgi:HSP20 family protein